MRHSAYESAGIEKKFKKEGGGGEGISVVFLDKFPLTFI